MGSRVADVTLVLPDGGISNQDIAPNAAIDATKLAQRSFSQWPIEFSRLRVWDNFAAPPVTTAAADDLALLTGTPGTDCPKLSTGDLKAAGATSRKIGFDLVLPANYESGKTVQIAVRSGMETTIADTSALVDLQAYKADGDGTVGSDLVTTPSGNCNSLTIADFAFTIDPSGLVAGDHLLCVLTLTVTDAAETTAVIGVVTELRFKIDTRG